MFVYVFQQLDGDTEEWEGKRLNKFMKDITYRTNKGEWKEKHTNKQTNEQTKY